MRALRRCGLLLGLSLLSATGATAQVEGPRAGTWGAEAATGPSASLLKFRSETSAWLLGVDARYVSRDVDPPTPIAGVDDDQFFGELRLGLRRYSRPQQPLRSFATLTGIVGYTDTGFEAGPLFGAGFEMGAAWFFSPHVSLGVSGDASVTYQRSDRDLVSGPQKVTVITARFNGFSLLGAVYF